MTEHIKKYTQNEYWLVPFGIMVLCFITFVSASLVRDGDIYFMVANGEYILHNGFPKTNPFVIHEGLKIVIQQWIPSVVAYLGFSAAPWPFLVVEAILGIYLLVFAAYKLINVSEPSRQKAFFMATLVAASMLYLFVGKPMLYSIILLTFQLYICESRKAWWWLPIIVFLEANVHASFIAFHFVYLLPYIVPGLTKYLKNDAEYRYIKALPLMAVAAISNPYGLDGALYLYKSYGTDLVSLGINELKTINPTFIWFWLLVAYAAFTIMQIYRLHIKKSVPLSSSKFYVFAGSVLLIILFPQSRNYIFTILGTVPLMSTFLPTSKGKTPSAKVMWVLAAGLVALMLIMIPTLPNRLPSVPVNGVKYISELDDYKLFTSFNEGSYYEYNHIKGFIDARPELYMKRLNGKADVLEEFKTLVLSKDESKIQAVLDKYQFTHLSVRKKTRFARYLQKHGYKVVAKDKEFYLYEKI